MACVARSHGRDQRRIQPAGQQDAVGHVGHQLPVHGAFERLAQFVLRHLHAFDGRVVAPGLLVVLHQRTRSGVVVVTRRELRHVGADRRQRLHFGGHTQATFAVMPPVQRADADGIARDQCASLRLVP